MLLVALLALLPFGVKWLQRRMVGDSAPGSAVQSKVISAVAVGPRLHVVTVEVGSTQERVRLVLGVTAQSITCLHQMTLPPSASDLSPNRQIGSPEASA